MHITIDTASLVLANRRAELVEQIAHEAVTAGLKMEELRLITQVGSDEIHNGERVLELFWIAAATGEPPRGPVWGLVYGDEHTLEWKMLRRFPWIR